MTATLTPPSPLYCLPNDVYDLLGVDAVQLRLDDRMRATGQTIQATATAAVGASTIGITALQYPLIAGSVLEFDGGGTTTVVEAVVATTAMVGSTTLLVVPLTAAVNALATALDNGVNLATAQRLLKGCWYGTAKVNDYCLNRYDAPVLAGNPTVNEWATAIAARWVAGRRGNACPMSVLEDAERALEDLKAVKVGSYNIGGIGTRTSGWPFISNVTVDLRYTYARVRVEPGLSEGTPTQYGQFIDWNSALFIEY